MDALAVILAIVGLAMTVAWVIVPFVIFGIKSRLDILIDIQRQMRREARERD